jgi:hypothetical protein
VHNINTAIIPRIDLAAIVDDLGHLKARAADIKRTMDGLHKQLTDAGTGAFDGYLYRATVSVSDRAIVNRDTFINELIKAGVNPETIISAEFAATTVSPATTVRVCARKA